MTLVRVVFTLVIPSLCACSPRVKQVDIDAAGYHSGPVTGRELLTAARSHAVLATSQDIGMEMLVQKADLSEQERVRIRQRIDYLMTTIFESTELASKYLDPVFSEADRRLVFRAVEDRVERALEELRTIRITLRRAATSDTD